MVEVNPSDRPEAQHPGWTDHSESEELAGSASIVDFLRRFLSYACRRIWSMREALAQIRGVASGLVDAPVWPLPDEDVVVCLDEVHAAEQVLAAVKLHLVREVEGRDLPGGHGTTGVAVWLRSQLPRRGLGPVGV